jgi:hypothetical protein
MSRHTFVIQFYEEGPCTLENVSTQERVSVPDLAAVGAQIERWLRREKPPRPERTRKGTAAP